MPYGRPAAGGLGLLHRYVDVNWATAGGFPDPGAFVSDFIEVAPQAIFIGSFNTTITFADGSGSAELFFGFEDDAANLFGLFASGPISSADGGSGGLNFVFDLQVVGLPTPGEVRAGVTAGASEGPPLTGFPQPRFSSGWGALNSSVLNANLWRVVIQSVSGAMIGDASGYLAETTGG